MSNITRVVGVQCDKCGDTYMFCDDKEHWEVPAKLLDIEWTELDKGIYWCAKCAAPLYATHGDD